MRARWVVAVMAAAAAALPLLTASGTAPADPVETALGRHLRRPPAAGPPRDVRLARGETRYDWLGVRTLPARPGDRPATTPDAAVAAVHEARALSEGLGGPPTVTLVRYFGPRLKDRLVWVVTFPDALLHFHGGPAGSTSLPSARCPLVRMVDARSLTELARSHTCRRPRQG